MNSFKFFNEALKLSENTKDSYFLFFTKLNLGNAYYYSEDFTLAEKYYLSSLKDLYKTGLSDYTYFNNILNNLGVINAVKGNFLKAESYFFKSLYYASKTGKIEDIGYSYNNLGELYFNMKYSERARIYYLLAMQYKIKSNIRKNIIDGILNYSYILYHLNNYDSSLYYLEKLNNLINEDYLIKEKKMLYYLKTCNFLKLNKKDSAFVYFNKYSEFTDKNQSLQLNEFYKKSIQNLELENKLKTDSLIKSIELKHKETQIKNQKNLTLLISVFLFTILVFTLLLFNRYKINVTQKNIIEKQKTELEEKNQNITQSIQYASRIQNSFLPSENRILTYFPKSYLIYFPRDIVSGDFYYILKKQDELFCAVADCTGHGVPGSLMSMLCFTTLNKVINEENISETHQILDRTRFLVSNTLNMEIMNLRDGMDVVLIKLNPHNGHLQYSGANRPLWIKRRNELIILKPDKQPVGYYEFSKPFTYQNFELIQHDRVYLFSDGITDQFHHQTGKKFTSNRLKELILGMENNVDISEEKNKIVNEFKLWKSVAEQTDDVCLLAFEYEKI
ncbi:MAG: SpoIIE family protein phosphatase [Bacteroidia bacterium]|nr:SpoIIE family protein phosphatase [Bacteroidia bacterium]